MAISYTVVKRPMPGNLTFSRIYGSGCEKTLLVTNFQLLLIQQLSKVDHQLGFMMILGSQEILQLLVQLLNGILGDTIAVSQGGNSLLQSIGSGCNGSCPFKELNGLLVILLESESTEPLLERC
jgi:hypothetical protein